MKLGNMSIKKTKMGKKLLTVASLTSDEVGSEIGVWLRNEIVNGEPVRMIITKQDNGSYMVADGTHILPLTSDATLEEVVIEYNKYITALRSHDIVVKNDHTIITRNIRSAA